MSDKVQDDQKKSNSLKPLSKLGSLDKSSINSLQGSPAKGKSSKSISEASPSLDWSDLDTDDIWDDMLSSAKSSTNQPGFAKSSESSDKNDADSSKPASNTPSLSNLFEDIDDALAPDDKSKKTDKNDTKPSDSEKSSVDKHNDKDKQSGIKYDGIKYDDIKSKEIKAEDKKAEEEKSEDKKAEEEKSEDKKAEDKKSEDKKSEDKKAEEEKSEDKKAEDKKAEDKKSKDKKAEEEKSEDKKAEDKKSEDKKAKDKKTDDIAIPNIPLPEGDIPTYQTDEDDGEGAVGEIRLSVRAQMGKVYPDNEVVEGSHVLKPDHTYTDAECKPNRDKDFYLRIFLIASLVLFGTALIYGGYYLYNDLTKPHHVGYHQEGAFQYDTSAFNHIYVSDDARRIAMCSDSRGIVLVDNKIAAQFWPINEGCEALRMSQTGDRVWYLSTKKALFEVNLHHDGGSESRFLAKLSDMSGTEFDISNGDVIYFAKASGITPVLRRQNLTTNDTSDQTLPSDALTCSGIDGLHFGYVSGSEIHMIQLTPENAIQYRYSSSLDQAKFHPQYACDRLSTLACAVDSDNNWSVLCKKSIRQGKEDISEAPIGFDNKAIVSGADTFKLIRHPQGTELITSDSWIRLDSNQNQHTYPLNKRLDPSFDVAFLPDEQNPLVGTNKGSIFKISPDGEKGQITVLTHPQNDRMLVGSVFIGDGVQVITIHHEQEPPKTHLSLWDLREGRLVNTKSISGGVVAINVSQNGKYGFLLNDATPEKIIWASWTTGDYHEDMEIENRVTDAIWSDDGQYVLIYFEDNSVKLFTHTDDVFSFVRDYPSDTVISFARNGLLWRLENDRLYLERIEDASISVAQNILPELLEGKSIQHITTTYPHSDKVILWGNDGIFIYDHENKLFEQIISKPTKWLVINHHGKAAVSNLGIIDLESHEISQIPNGLSDKKLSWIGSDTFLQTSDGGVLYNIDSSIITQHIPNMDDIEIIGPNGGQHPSMGFSLSNRDNIVTLSFIQKRKPPKILGLFSGMSPQSWCWITSNGAVQTLGNACVSVHHDHPSLPTTNKHVTDFLKATLTQSSETPKPLQPLVFSDDVTVKIDAYPQKAMLSFAIEDGELPEAIPSKSVPVPFSAQMKKYSQTIQLTVSASGHASRKIDFRPDMGIVDLYVPLLNNKAASSVTLVMHPIDHLMREDTIPENLSNELKNLAFDSKSSLTQCLKGDQAPSLIMILNDAHELTINEKSHKNTECFKPFMEEIAKRRSEGTLRELNLLSQKQFELSIR